jgi:excisionase family DNA binding protein
MQNGHEDGWLSLPEAAAELNCSVDTVRRRIKRGELPAKQVATQRGNAWRVLLSTPLSSVPTVGNDATQPAAHEDKDAGIVALVELVSRLQEENRTLAGQLGFVQAQAQQAEETIRALQAGAEQAASDAPANDRTSERAAVGPFRPWWKFWVMD